MKPRYRFMYFSPCNWLTGWSIVGCQEYWCKERGFPYAVHRFSDHWAWCYHNKPGPRHNVPGKDY